MAFFQCNLFSEALGMACTVNALIPQATRRQIGVAGQATPKPPYPTLFLLHGLTDDHTAWMRNSSIERYATQHGIAVIMPNVHRSFYTDMAYGYAYQTYVEKELPELCRQFFPLSHAREDNFIAGLSMGGYGSFKIALHNPGQYAAAASLSGVMDVDAVIRARGEERKPEFQSIFGMDLESLPGSEHDLFHLIETAVTTGVDLPKLFFCCGTEDFLYQDNIRFREHVRQLGHPITYRESAGAHTWDYWDDKIQEVLEWLPIRSDRSTQPI